LFAITWIATLVGTAIVSLTMTRQYRPQATLEIRPETPLVTADSNDPAMMASRNLWENYYRTQESILSSATLHEAALRAIPEPLRREFEEKPDPVAAFAKRVDIEKVRSSFILKVGFIDPDKEKATQIVNVLVSLYLEEANKHLRDLRSGAADVLSRETLPAMRQKVDDADKALRDFQADNGFIDPQEQYAALANSRRTILERVTQIRLRELQLRAQVDALRDPGIDGGGVFNPIFQNTKLLEILSTQQEALESELSSQLRELKADHPQILQLQDQLKRVKDKIRQAIRGMIGAFETELSAAEAEEKAAILEQKRTEKEMADISLRVFQAKRLDAELTTSRELYNSYLKKHGEEVATSGGGLGSVRIIDKAVVPVKPYKPDILINLSLGAVVGLLIGVAAMFVSEQLDDRIRSAHEVQVFLGLEVLAVVPRLGEKSAGRDTPLLLDEKSSIAEFETFRAMRSELTTRLEDIHGPKIVGVLSPMSGEGKSTVTANLAKVLAMDGRRVLIFDADMRRPTMNPNFGSKELPDLGAVLNQGADFRAAVRPSKIPGVDVVGMAAGTSHAAELAGSPAFDEIFKQVRQGYDYVIVDSAPVNQASESALIARRCDAVVMVLRERRTSRGAAQASRRRLAGMGVRVLGAALNAVEGPETAYGYYGYYYSYYKTRDDKTA
ncbi:MAG TPA: polysaccharide biosynthesis tyrosine autokinase, partial [Planctomycetota bacterium]|nr:polysaccharide biosynthesis tyrosine autokinase [Planctomycetota bacterium]